MCPRVLACKRAVARGNKKGRRSCLLRRPEAAASSAACGGCGSPTRGSSELEPRPEPDLERRLELRDAGDDRLTEVRVQCPERRLGVLIVAGRALDRKSTRLNSSHLVISY